MTTTLAINPDVVPAIVVHGGAGTITDDRHARVRAGVRAAAEAGHAILAAGGSALDAVVAAVRVLEDDPDFNAGTGAVLTRDGTVETDAAVMDGASRRIGAVGAVPDLGCAIAVARAILDAGEHVLLVGPAALRFAAERGIAPAAPGALIVSRQLARWRERIEREATSEPKPDGDHGGTVGAVARDHRGQLAAATSTGGTAWKRPGRVGDSPIPGAGTWADDTIATSATGDGEAILRVALAHQLAHRLATPGTSLDAAIAGALADLATRTGGSAGLIAVTRDAFALAQLSRAMPVAWIAGDDRGDSLGRAITP